MITISNLKFHQSLDYRNTDATSGERLNLLVILNNFRPKNYRTV